jgi:HTH-type transcriptional regulator/antitoxin HigA
MIHNKKQLAVALKSIAALQERLDTLKNSESTTDLLQVHAWKSRIEDLSTEVEEFNGLMEVSELEFSAENLQKAVISLRIASGMTQKQLADAIEVQEQQIQRYEQNHYQTASFERIIQILRVLSKHIQLKITPKKEQTGSRFEDIYMQYPNIAQKMEKVRERKELMTLAS